MDYADFFDESVQMLCVAGLDGHFHFVNPAFVEALGLSEEEVLATPYLELVHPDDVPATRDELEKLARGQITTDFECRFRRGDGDYILLSWFARAKPDGRIYAAARDVTRFRELLDSERRYRELYEEAPDMFVSVDPSSRRIVACNATTCETLGYTRDELMGQPVGKLYHPDSVERIPAIFGEFRRAGRAEAEVTLALKDGSPLPASLRVSAIRDERGRIRYSASVLRDITQKKVQEAEIERLQAQLRERAERSEDRMAAILGALPDLVVEIRLDGGIEGVHIHPEVEGAEAVAFVGRNLADVLPPDVVPRALEMMRDCVEEDEPRVL